MFNNNFISALCTMDHHSPLYLWDCLLHQFNLTLNMLWQPQINPGLSEYKQVDSAQIFERTPLALLGYKVQINEIPHQRCTYDPNSVNGWYLGPEVNHYRSYTWYNIFTQEEILHYIQYLFYHIFMKMPSFSSRDMAIHTVAYMEKALQTPQLESPFQVGESQLKAMRVLDK